MKDNPVAKNAHKFNKRAAGPHKDKKRALKKGDRKHKGQYENIGEKLSPSDGVAAWIKDFQQSDAPQFQGKSAEKRKEMALAAYLDAKKGSKNEFFGRLALAALGGFAQYKRDQKVDHPKAKKNSGWLWDHKEEEVDEVFTSTAIKNFFKKSGDKKKYEKVAKEIDKGKYTVAKAAQMFDLDGHVLQSMVSEWACNTTEKTRRVKGGDKRKKYMKEKQIEEGEKKGLWDRIHAKRKRGEKPAKPGEKGYPKTLDVGEGLKQARKNVGSDSCWDGYKATGTKMKNGKEVPDCKKESTAAYGKSQSNIRRKQKHANISSSDKAKLGKLSALMKSQPRKEENLDELSVNTLNNYRRKASKPNPNDSAAKQDKRYSGVARASRKLDKKLSGEAYKPKVKKAPESEMSKRMKRGQRNDPVNKIGTKHYRESAQDRLDRMAAKHGLGKPNKAADDYLAKMMKKYGAKDMADLKKKMGMKEEVGQVDEISKTIKKAGQAAKTAAINTVVRPSAQAAIHTGVAYAKDTAKDVSTGAKKVASGAKKVGSAVKKVTTRKPVKKVNENFRTLATKGMGAEKKSDIKVGHTVDFYDKEAGNKHTGDVVAMSAKSYTVRDERTKKYHTFNYYDPTKARKLMKESIINELTQRELDMMADRKKKNLVKRGKAKAEPKASTYVSNRKGDDDHVIMQLRKAQDRNGNMDIEVAKGKKTKLPKKMIDKLLTTYDKLGKPQDKKRFVTLVNHELRKRAGVAPTRAKTSSDKAMDDFNKMQKRGIPAPRGKGSKGPSDKELRDIERGR